MKYLVTGARGFIGRHVAEALRVRHGADAVVAIGREEADLADRNAVDDMFRRSPAFDYIVHLADVSGDARWAREHAVEQFLANAYMAVHVIDAWVTHQPQARLIGASTLWAYPEKLEIASERHYWDGPLHQPTEHYGIVKKLFGAGIGAARRQRGARGTMLALGSVYGPGDDSSHVIPSLIRRMRESPDVLEVAGRPGDAREFVFVDDQVEGILTHLDCDEELLNVSSGVPYTLQEVVDTLVRLSGYRGRVVFTGDGAPSRRTFDVSRATALTGWPSTATLHTLEAGLARTLAASDPSLSR